MASRVVIGVLYLTYDASGSGRSRAGARPTRLSRLIPATTLLSSLVLPCSCSPIRSLAPTRDHAQLAEPRPKTTPACPVCPPSQPQLHPPPPPPPPPPQAPAPAPAAAAGCPAARSRSASSSPSSPSSSSSSRAASAPAASPSSSATASASLSPPCPPRPPLPRSSTYTPPPRTTHSPQSGPTSW